MHAYFCFLATARRKKARPENARQLSRSTRGSERLEGLERLERGPLTRVAALCAVVAVVVGHVAADEAGDEADELCAFPFGGAGRGRPGLGRISRIGLVRVDPRARLTGRPGPRGRRGRSRTHLSSSSVSGSSDLHVNARYSLKHLDKSTFNSFNTIQRLSSRESLKT